MNHAEHDESIGSMLASIAAALREVSDKLDVVAARVQQEVPAFPADEDLPDQTRIRRLESWAFHASQDISRLSSRLDALDGGDGDQPPPPTPRGTRSRREVREAAERAAAERGEPDIDEATQRPPLERRHSRTDHLGDPTWPLTVAPVPRAAEDRAASAEWTAPEEVRVAPEAPAAQEPARASDDGSTRAALAELIAALQADAGVQVTLPPDSSPGGGLSPEGPGGGGGARTVNGARREDAPSPGHRGGVASSAAEVPPRNGYPAADTSGRAPQASLNGAGSATASSTDAPSRNGRRSATASSPVEAASRNGARAAGALAADTSATASTGIRVLDESRPPESLPEIAPRNGSGTTDSRPTSDSDQDALPPRSATATPRNGARPIPTRALSEPVGARALDTDAQTRNGSRHGANPALDSAPGARSETDRAQQAHDRDLDSTRAGGQVSEPGRALDREQSAGGSRSAEARTAEEAQQPADSSADATGDDSRAVHGSPVGFARTIPAARRALGSELSESAHDAELDTAVQGTDVPPTTAGVVRAEDRTSGSARSYSATGSGAVGVGHGLGTAGDATESVDGGRVQGFGDTAEVPVADGPTSTAGSAAAAPVGGHGAPGRDAGFTSSADAGVADPFSEEKTEVGMRPVGVERARPVSRHGDDVTVPGVVARHGVPEARTGSDGEEPVAEDPRSAGLTAGHHDESPVNGRAVNGFDARAVADHGTAVSGSTANGIQWTFTDEDLTTPSAPSPAGHPRNGFTGGSQHSDSSVDDRGPGSPSAAPHADAPAPPTRLSAPKPDAPNRPYATDSGYLPGLATPPGPDTTFGPDTPMSPETATRPGPATNPGSALTNPATPASSSSEPRSTLTSPAAGPGEPGTPTAPAHFGAHNASIELPTRGSSAEPSSPTPSGLPTRSPARLSAHRTTMDAADLAGLTNPSVTPAPGNEARPVGTNHSVTLAPSSEASPADTNTSVTLAPSSEASPADTNTSVTPGPGGEARPTGLTNPSASPASRGETRPTGLTNPGAPVSSGNAADLSGSSASTTPGTAHFDSSGDTGAAGAPSVRPTVEPVGRPGSPAYTGDAAVAEKADFDAFTNTGAPEAPTGRVTAQRADGLTHADTPTTFGSADFDTRAANSAAPGHQAPFDAAADLPSAGGRVGSANSTPLTGSTAFTTPAPAGSAPERFDTGNYSGTTEFTGTVNGATAPDSPATSPLRRITSDPAPPTETDAAGITVTGTFRAFDREERAHGDKLQAMLDELKRSAGLQRRDVFGPPPTDAG
ncbi:hypothetical protein [Nocardia asteroides]|uniref:hypothetical protein n=1 Tax=Nocardia asteroides TaxID=1824 RepID=UPI003654DD3F